MKTLHNILANAPGDVVSYTIIIGKKAIPKSFGVLSISVSCELNHISIAKITLIDGDVAKEDFETSNSDLFIPGQEIKIFIGHTSHEKLVFQGIITAQHIRIRKNGSSQLTVEARDQAYRMSIGAKRRYFTDAKDGDILEEIIEGYKIKPKVTATALVHPEMVQHASTDWDFIIMRAEMNGFVCLNHNGQITISPPDFKQEAAFSFQYGEEILELDLKLEGRNQYQGVKAYAWDYAKQELQEIEAREPKIQEAGNLHNANIAKANKVESYDLLHSGRLEEAQLQAWADGKLLKNRLSKIRGRARCFGTADILPGQTIKIEGVGNRFNGLLYVSGVKHSVGNGAWVMDLQFGLSPEWFSEEYKTCYPPASGMVPAISGLQIGIVTQIEGDPEREDRVKLRIPIIDPRDQGIWARVNALDAGAERGSFFRPEVGDEVLVGFINDDPRDPVIMGMLHSRTKPAPFTATANNFEKGFVSREGMKVVFNEEEKSILMETPNGNQLKIDESQKGFVFMDENGNQIIMNDQGITIKSIKHLNIESADDISVNGQNNISISANNRLNVQGTTAAELSSSTRTVIKGTRVDIN